jgi:hypothetical protein
VYPDLAKGTKCFACRSFGHKSFECPNKELPKDEQVVKSNYVNVYQINTASMNGRMVKYVYVSSVQTKALTDTGCDLNLYCQSFQSNIKIKEAVNSRITLIGPAGAIIQTIQKFVAELKINDSIYQIEVNSVSDEAIACDFIIGRSLFQKNAELRIRPGLVEINEVCPEVAQIMANEVPRNEINFGFKEYSTIIMEMVSNYIPCATELTPVKTRIIVSDAQVVYQRPRRFTPKERIAVDRQVEECLC